MKLTKYALKLFLPLFTMSLFFFSFLIVLVELLMNIWRYLANNVPLVEIMRILLYYAPKAFSLILPVAVLFASCYMLSNLYKDNELTALFASGVSLLKFSIPIIACSVILSFALFTFEDLVVVPNYKKHVQLKNEVLKIADTKNNNHIVILGENGSVIYNADFYDDAVQRLNNVILVVRNDDKTLNCIVKANNAAWSKNDNHWKLSVPTEYKYLNEQLVFFPFESDIEKRLTEIPETFRNNVISVEESSVKESKEYISHLKRVGLPYGQALSEYYKKYSFPCITIIVILFSIGLSGRSRRNALIVSLISTLGATVLFYIIQMVTMLMAKFGYISAFWGAWFPVALFTILSVLLVRYTKT